MSALEFVATLAVSLAAALTARWLLSRLFRRWDARNERIVNERQARRDGYIGHDVVELPEEGEVLLSGGVMLRTHPRSHCEGEHCCIHNPSDHHMRTWPQSWRQDRQLMERRCPHGIGHPDPDDLAHKRRNNLADAAGVHGCDGCCVTAEYVHRYLDESDYRRDTDLRRMP